MQGYEIIDRHRSCLDSTRLDPEVSPTAQLFLAFLESLPACESAR